MGPPQTVHFVLRKTLQMRIPPRGGGAGPGGGGLNIITGTSLLWNLRSKFRGVLGLEKQALKF